MPTWIVQSAATAVAAEGEVWLDALAAALPHFNIPLGSLGTLSCAFNADGSVEVRDPRAHLHLHVAPIELVSSGAPEAPVDRAARLFERCAVISGAADIGSAANIALTLARDIVPAESGAVLMTTRNARELQFVSAFGPCASRVIDTVIGVNEGIAGFITNFQTGAIIHDTTRDCRFDAEVDRSSGYHTRAMIAVPISSAPGPCFGCLQLINAPDRFRPRDLRITQTVASALAAWLVLAEA